MIMIRLAEYLRGESLATMPAVPAPNHPTLCLAVSAILSRAVFGSRRLEQGLACLIYIRVCMAPASERRPSAGPYTLK